MSGVTKRQIQLLRPYLIGEQPKSNSEWDMYCPLHDDSKRSASLNVETGAWYCFAGCGGGSTENLVRARSRWVPPGVARSNGSGHTRHPSDPEPQEIITEGHIAGWHAALLDNEYRFNWLAKERRLKAETIERFEIGWDMDRNVYSIPVRGPNRQIWNVRRYNPDSRGATKIWSVSGMRVCELYPFDQLGNDELVIAEGEWDTLLTIQNGFPAITRTAGAGTWKMIWSPHFEGKKVYICQDRDDEGAQGTKKIVRALSQAADIRLVELPYEQVRKHGKDLTDFWKEHSATEFEGILSSATKYQPDTAKIPEQSPDVTQLRDSFNPESMGDPVKVHATIKARKRGYVLPRLVSLHCTQDAGAICGSCPLNVANGEGQLDIPSSDPILLELAGMSKSQVHERLRKEYGAMKCQKLSIEVKEFRNLDPIIVRQSIDRSDGTQPGDFESVEVSIVDHYTTPTNITVELIGARHPSPKDQSTQFLAWELAELETSVDRFSITPETIELLRIFQTAPGQSPLRKLSEISRELSQHVTKIIGRPEMHAVMDLTFHSVLSWDFGGQLVERGWLDSLVIGDTRTGKSEAAERLVRHYRAGEIIGGEAASFAGLVGGVQQVGGRDWFNTWGLIPLNDRRLVVIDETSGLQPEDIAKMSDIRSSGRARITKIVQEETRARTRLLWLGNPRSGGMDQFTYGVDAIRPLIGNPEDIARYDLAMAVGRGDVPSTDINRPMDEGQLSYPSAACHTLLLWAWTRRSDQVVWVRDAERRVFDLAVEMGNRYVEDPPLIQAANVRIKIARVAVALAARTFSTDAGGECLFVGPEHVEDAVWFIDHLYEMPGFGYAEQSRKRLEDLATAKAHRNEALGYVVERRGLASLLRGSNKFKRQDLEDILNIERTLASGIVNRLHSWKMVRREGSVLCIEPTLQEILRDIKHD